MVKYIRRILGVLVFKRFSTQIIFLDAEASYWAKKIINTHLVLVLSLADHRSDKRFKITFPNCFLIDHSFLCFISIQYIFVLRNPF